MAALPRFRDHGLRSDGLPSTVARGSEVQSCAVALEESCKILTLVLLSWSSLLPAQILSPEVKEFVKVNAPVIALEHVRVIDGTGAPAREDQTVILAKGKIESIAKAASAGVPTNAQVLDLHGYSVIPGLVGMHDHMFYPMGNGVYGEMAYSFPRLYL